MRTKLLMIAGVAMATAFVSCSSDEVVSTPSVITSDMTTAYAKVAISMPKSTTTRADGLATEEEQAINEIHLALYDENGIYVGNGEIDSEINTSKGLEFSENTPPSQLNLQFSDSL